ncbi:hypothetical protein Tsubulata_046504 [Turnera subulata]|uniref:Uncharacterized protein n=1 Tax=Turnera subulata TaxID=218843 RepID=A0A9Q0GFC3_9ROSI|nr:hypothetical protein Tsubulata_046504 [Turnera subulata]
MEASPLVDPDHSRSAVTRVLKEVSLISNSIFQSLLLFLSATTSKSKQSRWSLVSRLMHRGVVACEEKQANVNELDIIDAALTEESEKMEIALERLEALEISVEELDNCLEPVFRCLIKTRSSLLNIMSQ